MWLLKAGGCLIQFKYISLWIFGQLSSGCLIQVGCLIEVTTNTGLTVPGLLLLIDFEKAFDSLSWSFIQKVLKFLNFGPSICRWIETFYSNITSSVIQCGFMSESFRIGRGCRQGDPLSPYIFIICAEFLAIKIRQNSKIKGIKIHDTEFKISQYADDTSIFLDGSSDALNGTLTELDKFANVSDLKINFDKTQSCMDWLKKA